MNRVLGSVHYESDLPDAIEQIRAFRKKHGGVYNAATQDQYTVGAPVSVMVGLTYTFDAKKK